MLKKLKRVSTKFRPYNPQRFWEKSDKFLSDPWQHRIFPQHSWLLKKIKTTKPKSILEVGCGFGRNLIFLKNNKVKINITGVDISSFLLTKAKADLKGTGIILKHAPAQKLPFGNNSFDFVFTHGLLMHVKPAQIKPVIAELSRVAKSDLVLIEEIRKRPHRVNYFTFTHDYLALTEKQNLKVLEKKYDKHNLIWLHLKKS